MSALPEFIKQKYALANALQISRTTLNEYLKLKRPDVPKPDPKKGYNVMQVLAYVKRVVLEERKQVNSRSRAGEGLVTDLAALRMRQMLAQCEKIELANDIERGKYVKRDVIAAELGECVAKVESDLRKRFESELPSELEGMTAIQIKARNKRELDESFTTFHELNSRYSE